MRRSSSMPKRSMRRYIACRLSLREALLGDADQLFSVTVEGRHETYHVSRRTFPLEGDLHTILTVKHLTREIARREVEVLKQVVSGFLEGYAAVARLPRPNPRRVELARFAQQLALLHPEVKVRETANESAWFDPVQVEQVVINLVKNAREAGSPK